MRILQPLTRLDFLRKIPLIPLLLSSPDLQEKWWIHSRQTNRTFGLSKWSYYLPVQSIVILQGENPIVSEIKDTMLSHPGSRNFVSFPLNAQTYIIRDGNSSLVTLKDPFSPSDWMYFDSTIVGKI